MDCPCLSQKSYSNCCEPFHLGVSFASTAEELMRSRYSAFVKNKVDYVVNTHHPDTRDSVDLVEIKNWASNSEWKGLEILGSENGLESDEEGLVDFIAKYEVDGEFIQHKERSLFKKDDGRWFFYNAASLDPVKREGPKVGRNDPCPCGSGKKYKKCCLNKL